MSSSLTRWPLLRPQAEIEGEMGHPIWACQARHWCRKHSENLPPSPPNQNHCYLHQSNQDANRRFLRQSGNDHRRQGFEILFFGQDGSPKAVQKKGEEVIGNRVKVKIVKNKVAAPTLPDSRVWRYLQRRDLLHRRHFKLGRKIPVLSKSGASYSYEGTGLGRGYDSAKTFLVENPKVTKELETKIKKRRQSARATKAGAA